MTSHSYTAGVFFSCGITLQCNFPVQSHDFACCCHSLRAILYGCHFHQFCTKFFHASRQKSLITIINLPRNQSFSGCHYFISGSQNSYSYPTINLHFYDSHTGQYTCFNKSDFVTLFQKNRSIFKILSLITVILPLSGRTEDSDSLFSIICILLTDTAVTAFRNSCACHNPNRLPLFHCDSGILPRINLFQYRQLYRMTF